MRKFYLYLFMLFIINISFKPTSAQTDNGWILKAGQIDLADYYGITVANGMIGIVSSPTPFQVKDIVLNGAYDEYGRGRVSNILKGFNFVNMNLDIDSERISASNISHFSQQLDMKAAELQTSFDFKDKATVTYSLLALRQLPYSAMINVTVHAKKDIAISPASVIEAPDLLRNVQQYYSDIDRPHALIHLLTSYAQSPTGKLSLAASTSFIFPEKRGDEPQVIHEMWDHNMHLMRFVKHLNAGDDYTFSIVGSTISTAQHSDPLNEAERLTIFAALQGRQELLNGHRAAWDSLWRSDIIIDGDPQSQLEVRSMLYQLYSFERAGTDLSLSPMGLSGLGYNGHIFWDADLWMYPALLILHPEMARSMIDYRYNRLAEAKQNAFEHGYKGAMFPWESAASGNEETPVWALSGPFEHHITADVGIAAWSYFCVTQDTSWLREKGYPILEATANFWASRVQRNGSGHYDINNVVAADEWAENVDNNAFTNAAAIINLRDAVKAANILGLKADDDWTNVADNIPVLKFPDGVIKEHASYHGEAIKQADVNLLSYPLGYVTDSSQVRKDLEYYEPRIGNGPAMSYAVLATLYARLGAGEKAYQLFHRAYRPNKRPPFGVLAETADGTNPYFATGAGGVLQAMLNGFSGLEITDEGIMQIKTALPKEWQSVTITGAGKDRKTYSVKH